MSTSPSTPPGQEWSNGSGLECCVWVQAAAIFEFIKRTLSHLKFPYNQSDKSDSIVVLNFQDKQKKTPGTYAGREAKEMALKLLSEKGFC